MIKVEKSITIHRPKERTMKLLCVTCCALSGPLASIESYLCRELSVNCSALQDTLSERFAESQISEPYTCQRNCSLVHTILCLFCLSYLYSRQTFPGTVANLCDDELTVCRQTVDTP